MPTIVCLVVENNWKIVVVCMSVVMCMGIYAVAVPKL